MRLGAQRAWVQLTFTSLNHTGAIYQALAPETLCLIALYSKLIWHQLLCHSAESTSLQVKLYLTSQ